MIILCYDIRESDQSYVEVFAATWKLAVPPLVCAAVYIWKVIHLYYSIRLRTQIYIEQFAAELKLEMKLVFVLLAFAAFFIFLAMVRS